MPRRYPPEVRRQVIELARSGTRVAQLAATFQMSGVTIYNWLKQGRIDRGEEIGQTTDQQLELAAAQRWIKQLETELAVARKVNEVFLREASAQKALPGDRLPDRAGVQRPPRLPHARVSESGYYAWKARPDPPRTLRRIWLAGEITDVHKASGGNYGAARVTAELKHGRGIQVGHNAVELIMRELGIKGTPTRRLPKGARVAQVTSLDLVRRVFARDRPNQLWLTDMTEHPTNEGKIYCCVVRDSFSRLVSDRLRAAGIAPSMGAAWKTRIELASGIHDYIAFHNTRRRHSSLRMLTPTEVEAAWAAN